MMLEIFIYLVIAFGALILCITMLEKDEEVTEKYTVLQNENVKVKVIVHTEGLDEEDVKKIKWILQKGKYDDIYDVACEFKVIEKN